MAVKIMKIANISEMKNVRGVKAKTVAWQRLLTVC
jgi:hypothetical protein